MHPVMTVRNNGLSQEYDEKVRQLSLAFNTKKKNKIKMMEGRRNLFDTRKIRKL